MLQIIRDRMSGPLVWGIIGFLVLLFAVWGIGAQSFFGGGSAPALAKVGSVEITQPQFQNAFNRSYQRIAQDAGSNFDPSQINMSALREDVFNGLIRNAVIEQYAIRQGYRVSNLELYDYLKTIPSFQVSGHFSADTYRQVLARNGLAPEVFEGHLRGALRSEQLQLAVMGTSFIVPKQAEMNWVVANQRRDFKSVMFDPKSYRSEIHPTEKTMRAYYQKHKDKYIEPEAVKLAYIELNQAELSPSKPPHPSVLKTIYDQQKSVRFRVVAERKASQILIRFGNDPKAAQQQIAAIAEKLKQGAEFSSLAKQYSQDPISSAKGGVIGWVKQRSSSSAVERALFSLNKVGQVSAPIKMHFGWHLIRLDDIRPAHTLPFHDPAVQQALLRTFDSQEAARKFHQDQKKLSELSFEHPYSLDPVAKALGLPVKSTGWQTRDNATGIAKHRDVLTAAFSKNVLRDGSNSKPIAIGPGDLVVIRKAAVKARRQKPFVAVNDQIRRALITDEAAKDAEKAAMSFIKAVRRGVSFGTASVSAGLTPSAHTGVGRTDAALPDALTAALFNLPRPTKGHPSMGLAHLSDGRVAVIALTSVHDPVLKKAGDGPKYASFAEKLSKGLANLEFDNYWAFMATQIGIQVKENPGALSTPGQQG